MTEITELKNEKKQTPVDSAINQLRENAVKDIQKKINEKVKAASEARKAYNTLIAEIKDLLKEQEVEKAELATLLGELK